MRFKFPMLCVFLLLLGSLPVASHARDGVIWVADLSPSQAASKVVKKTGGKVLKVTLEERDGRGVYRVKVLLPEGRIKTVFVDKETGGNGG
ncbi:MAG: PepSY domain-containing protein [Pseudomonadota bacterium]|nr:PepSY domain-containing protein [Pseudomonadota bacterium]